MDHDGQSRRDNRLRADPGKRLPDLEAEGPVLVAGSRKPRGGVGWGTRRVEGLVATFLAAARVGGSLLWRRQGGGSVVERWRRGLGYGSARRLEIDYLLQFLTCISTC